MKTVLILTLLALASPLAQAGDHGKAHGMSKKEAAKACKGKKGKAMQACMDEKMNPPEEAEEGHDGEHSEEHAE